MLDRLICEVRVRASYAGMRLVIWALGLDEEPVLVLRFLIERQRWQLKKQAMGEGWEGLV